MNNDSIKRYQVIRDNAQKIVAESEESLDKYIMTIATALLGGSFAIFSFVNVGNHVVIFYVTLVLGWVALCTSIILCLTSIVVAKQNAQNMINAIDDNIKGGTDFNEQEMFELSQKYNKHTNHLNITAFTMLVIGIICCLLFVLLLKF